MAIIGLATVLYRRITGELSLKMMAFDNWAEELGYEDLGIEEIDTNAERAQAFAAMRAKIRALPHDEMMAYGRKQYRFFVENFEKLQQIVDQAKANGLTITDLLDRQIPAPEGQTEKL